MTVSDYKKIGMASAIMMASVFLSRVMGLLREMAIAYIGGVRGEVDAYQVAFVIPEILNHILASGFLSVTFIPIFSGYLVRDDEPSGWNVFLIILNTFGIALIILCAVAMVFAPALISMLAPGIDDPILRAAAARMTRIIIPAQFFFFAGGLFSAVQFAKDRFLIPAMAPLVYNFGIIFGGMMIGPRMGMEGFAWGALAGAGIGNFVLQYWGARRVGLDYRFKFSWSHPDVRKYARLTLPLMLGLTMTFSTEIFFKFFGSFLPRGGIAALNFSIRIMFILVGLFGQAVGVASYPALARLAADENTDEMNRILNQTLRLMALVIPLSVLFVILRHEIVFLLFQRGEFDAAATRLTAGVLGYIMIGAFAFSAQTIVSRGFYAIQNTLLPAVYQTAAVILGIPIYITGMRILGTNGVALAVSLSAFLQTLLLFHIWSRKSCNREVGAVYGFLLRVICLSLLVGCVFEWLKRGASSVVSLETFAGNALVSIVIGVLFLGVFAAMGHLFHVPEIRFLYDRIRNKIRKTD